jgi:hypothetical protein
MSSKSANKNAKSDNKTFTVQQVLEMKTIIEKRRKSNSVGENGGDIDFSQYFFKPVLDKVPSNKDPARRTYYMNVLAQHPTGGYIPFTLTLVNQVIAANAKPPEKPKKSEDQSAKHIKLTFMYISKEDIEKSSIKEAKKAQAYKDNCDLITALEFVSQELKRTINDVVIKMAGTTYFLARNKDINSFVQYKRKIIDGEKGDSDGKIDMEYPIYRIRIGADYNTGVLGQGPNSYRNTHKYIIYDTKKLMNETKKCKEQGLLPPKSFIIAQLNTTEGMKDLTLHNAYHFITRMSTVSGKIKLDNICISNFGISEVFSVVELHVWSHPFVAMQAFTVDELADMGEYGDSGSDNDTPIDLTAAVETAQKKKKTVSRKVERESDDDADDPIEDPEENDSDSDKKKPKPKPKPKPKAIAKPKVEPKPVKKSSKKVQIDSEEDEEEDEADPEETEEPEPEPEPEGKKAKPKVVKKNK